ncbi:MAG: PD-(D/E)XK nuclease family protein [Candidatus Kapabacteria bacterium]|nr:PD-(D/E)XK nuclease family protein [Candidatus Kapabacteria bacterium]
MHEDTTPYRTAITMPLWTTSQPDSSLLDAVQAETLERRIAAFPEGLLIVIVPTARQRREVLVAWARLHGRGEPPEIMTMSTFIYELGKQILEDGPRILPDASVDVLLRYAAFAAGTRPGVLRVRASRLARWAQEGMSPGLVRQLSTRVDSARRRRNLETVARIWSEFADLVGRRACDRGTYGGRVADEAARRDAVNYHGPSGDPVRRLLVLDTHGVTFTDRLLLHSLCKCDWDIGIAFAPELSLMGESESSRSKSDHMWLVSHGWYYDSDGPSTSTESGIEVVVQSFPTRSEEVRRALALAKEAVASGIELSDVALCVPGSSDYERIVYDLAAAGGIPIDIDANGSLASSRSASAVLSACSVITSAWQRGDVERLLRDPLVRAAIPDVSNLLKVAVEDRIVGGQGPDAWQERCERKRADALHYEAHDLEHAEEWGRKSIRYKGALRAIGSLRSSVDVPIDRPIDAARFSQIIEDNIIKRLGIFDRARAFEPTAITALEESLSSYRAVAKDHRLPSVHFGEHVRTWWTLVQSVPIASTVRQRLGLAVVKPAELRGQKRRLVIAVGCIEGEFPRTSVDMLDEDLTPGLRTAMAIESMADLSSSVTEDGLLLCTYPSKIDGAMVLPSSLLDRVSPKSTTNNDWISLDSRREILLDERDVRLRSIEPPTIDRSQRGIVADGLEGEVREQFEEDIARPISPSRIDVVAQCPFKYHAQKLLRLDDVGSDDNQLTPMERGTLLHEVVQRFYRSYQEYGAPDLSSEAALLASCVDLRVGTFDEHWARLCEKLDDVLMETRPDHLFAEVERRALVGTPERVGLLRRWLASEIQDQVRTGFLPVLFEYEIEVEVSVPFGDTERPVAFKTRIDRIDVLKGDSGVTFVVNDYKSTIAQHLTRKNVIEGVVTQMPVYLAVVAAFFSKHGILAEPAAAVYRAFGTAFRSPEKSEQRVVLADPSSTIKPGTPFKDYLTGLPLADQVQNIMGDVSPSILDLRRGVYPVRPTKDACRTCSFSALCRIDHWGVI